VAWGAPKIGAVATPVASGDYTLTAPAGLASGDLMIACIALRDSVGFDTPSGWDLITSQLTGDTDATNGIASGQMFYHVRGGSDPTLVFARTGGNVAVGCIIAYAGGHATPLDVFNQSTAVINTTSIATNPIVTSEDGELIVAMTAAGDTLNASAFDATTDPATASGAIDTTTAPTAGTWIQRLNSTTGTGADTGLGIADAIKALAGSTGNILATISGSARHVLLVASFKLAAAGGGGDAPISPYYSSYYSRMIQEGSQF
jgi:hypothetical protein